MTYEQPKNICIKEHGSRYKRNKIIEHRNIDNASFLVNPETEEIFYLNSLASAIWQLLTQPISIEEVAGIVIKAFPDALTDQINKDTSKLFAELISKDIVVCCD